jgi:hypothetical protein
MKKQPDSEWSLPPDCAGGGAQAFCLHDGALTFLMRQ